LLKYFGYTSGSVNLKEVIVFLQKKYTLYISGEKVVSKLDGMMSERTMRASSAAAREVLTARNIVLVSSGWQFCSTFAAKSGREEHKVFLSSLLTAKAKQKYSSSAFRTGHTKNSEATKSRRAKSLIKSFFLIERGKSER
jgi:hypothetical protein